MSRLAKILNWQGLGGLSTKSTNFDHLSDWISSLHQQRYSQHTIDAYHAALIRFLNFVDQDLRLRGQMMQCNKQDLVRFFGQRLEEDGIKNASARQDLTAIRKFYDFLITQDKIEYNPTTGYQLKAEPRPIPKIADEDLLGQLLDQPIPQDPAKARLWIRDKAMFELMYSSGLRLSELTSLNLGDVDFSEGMVRVLGKGNKVRQIPVGSKALAALQNYLPHRALWQENTEALFISERHGSRLSNRAVQLRLIACANMAGIDQHLHPHLLRHCFASHLLSASGDLRAIQEMLGHTNISTTQIYTQVDFGALTRVYDQAHPRANAKKGKRAGKK